MTCRSCSVSSEKAERRFVMSLLAVLTVLWLLMVFVLVKSRASPRRISFRSRHRHHHQLQQQQQQSLSYVQTQDLDAFSRLMANRSQRMYDLCNAEFGLSFDSVPADHFLLDRKKGMLYCAVPATKSVMPFSLLFSAEFRQYRPRHDSDGDDAEPDFLASAAQDDVEYLENYPVRLIVVRNPADRLVSFYRDHLEGTAASQLYKTLGRHIVAQYRDLAESLAPDTLADALRRVEEDVERERILGNPFANPPGPTFTEFVQYVLAHQSGVEYWSPYFDYCFSCGIMYNYVIRFENIEEEGNLLRLLLTPEDQKQITFFREIDAPSLLDELCSYLSQLDDNLFNQLLSMLASDFLLFNYSIDEILLCADEYVRQ